MAATREIRFRGTQRASSPPVRQASNWSRKSLRELEARSDDVGRLRLTRLREICLPDFFRVLLLGCRSLSLLRPGSSP